ncbi:hypothetical protein BayCH28_22245 [Mycolicibacterium sp. CH28]|uniref:hypothetical protein n=1 Tax=Mycolicibacterium sp. CH28 TaxID=2512237 RepID=UPI00108092CC|nr:hypothetical protein [Mycolicibacterium sp. CH28]TGD85125.1 hypothetical protein BayCH28_22245 [Mycolicibacterium sp. CH28]
MKTIESKEPLADIRAYLASEFESAASFRERVAEEYPEDERNARSAYELRRFAEEIRSNDVAYDDTPALRKLLGLVTKHDIDLTVPMLLPSDGSEYDFDVSRYRFNNAREDEEDFLNRLADTAEDWWRE